MHLSRVQGEPRQDLMIDTVRLTAIIDVIVISTRVSAGESDQTAMCTY